MSYKWLTHSVELRGTAQSGYKSLQVHTLSFNPLLKILISAAVKSK